jgi:hypothetical protein
MDHKVIPPHLPTIHHNIGLVGHQFLLQDILMFGEPSFLRAHSITKRGE